MRCPRCASDTGEGATVAFTDQNIRILTSGHASGTLPWMKTTPQNWKEARRLQAWHLKQQGWPQRQIAEALGVSEAAVSQWMTRARDGGPHALRHRPPSGAPRRLAAAQLARLPDLLHGEPRPMASVAKCGRGAESPRSCGWRSASPTTRCMSAGCSRPSGGAPKSLPGGLASATKRPLRAGGKIPGLPSRGGTEPWAEYLLHRRVGLLSPPQRGAHLCPRGPDAHLAGVVHP